MRKEKKYIYIFLSFLSCSPSKCIIYDAVSRGMLNHNKVLFRDASTSRQSGKETQLSLFYPPTCTVGDRHKNDDRFNPWGIISKKIIIKFLKREKNVM